MTDQLEKNLSGKPELLSSSSAIGAPQSKILGMDLLPWAGMVGLCILVFVHGLRASSGIEWPIDEDAFRDIGIAQSILDGTYPEDNAYRGETLWFNPMVGAMVAGVSWLTGLPAPVADARLGAYVNLLVPISFFLLCTVLFDSWIALAALSFFLFGVSRYLPASCSATYSPWLLAPSFAQCLFFTTLLVYWKAWSTDRRRWYVAAGVLLGITFMAHTAPAVLLGLIILTVTIGRLVFALRPGTMRADSKPIFFHFAIVMTDGFVCSLPYTYSTLWNYQFRILNDSPTRWVFPYLTLDNVPFTIRDALSVSSAIAYLGFAGIVFLRRNTKTKTLVLGWLGFAGLFLVYSYAIQGFERMGIRAPSIVPGYHFGLYIASAKAVLFGYGVVVAARMIADGLRKVRHLFSKRPAATDSSAGNIYWEHALTFLFTIVLCCLLYPSYRSWRELNPASIPFANHAPVYEWIMENSAPEDVFLCDDTLALYVVAPANRKVVATVDTFSNLYVDWKVRTADRDAMINALLSNRSESFFALCAKYAVTFIIVDQTRNQIIERLRPPFLGRVATPGPFVIYGFAS